MPPADRAADVRRNAFGFEARRDQTGGTAPVRRPPSVREVLEGLAARMCAEEAPPSLVESLDAVLAEYSVKSPGAESYARGDQEFHRLLAEACGNSLLTELIVRLHAQTKIALVRAADHADHRHHGRVELGVVLEAIRRRDPPAAEAAMRAHIERTRRLLEPRRFTGRRVGADPLGWQRRR